MDQIKEINNSNKYIRLKEKSQKIVSTPKFNVFVTLTICISAILIGAQTYRLPTLLETILFFLDYAITAFFAIEIAARYLASENTKAFFKEKWNIFDTLIVSISLIPLAGIESIIIIRLLRIFRIMRLISVIPELRLLVNSLFSALPRMAYIGLLMFIIFYIYGAIGATMFKNINPFLWGDVSKAMLTLFRISTFEGWTAVMYETQAAYPFSWLYYLSFIFLTAFVFLNMMVGSIIDVMSSEQEDLRRSKLNLQEQLQEPATIEQVAKLNAKLDLLIKIVEQKKI